MATARKRFRSVPGGRDPTADETPRSLPQRERERLTEDPGGSIVTKVAQADGTPIAEDATVLLQQIAEDIHAMRLIMESTT